MSYIHNLSSLFSLPPSSIPPSRTTGCWATFERRRRTNVFDGTHSSNDDRRESSLKPIVVSCRDITKVVAG